MKQFILLCICAFAVSAYAQIDPNAEVSDKIMEDYDRLMRSEPNNVESHRNFINKWKDRADTLILIYEKLATHSPDNPVSQYALGYAYAITEKDEDKAVQLFQKALELDPNFSLAHFSLGAMYLRKGEYKLAEVELQKTAELDERYYPAYFNLGEVYRNQKKYDLAMQAYKKSLEIKQDWGWPHYGMGMIYMEMGNLESAQAEFKQAIKYSPEIASAHFKLGLIYAMQDQDIELVSKEFREGQKVTGKGRIAKKEEGIAFYELGHIFAEKGKSGLAIQAYKNAINIDPNMAPAQLELGKEYDKMGLKERAIEHYKMAFKADPSLMSSLLTQAKEQYDSKSFDSALSTLEKLLAIEPENASAHYYYAEIQGQMNKPEEAIRHYEDTIRLDPNFVRAYIPLGDLYYSQGKVNEAISFYRKAIALDQSLERYFFNLGDSALKSAQKEEDADRRINGFNTAKANFEKFILLFPQDSSAHFMLGLSYEGLGDKNSAMKYYQKAVLLDPSRQDILLRIAGIYKEAGSWDESLATLSRLISTGEGTAHVISAYRMAAEIHEKLGNFDEAISALEQVTLLSPSDLEAHYKLGLFYEEKKGDIDRAMKEYEVVTSMDQTRAEPFLKLGAIYMKKQMDDSKIIDVLETGLTIDPNHAQLQYELALLYKKHRNYDKAIEHYGEANRLSPDNFQWHYEYAKLLDGRDNGKALQEYTRTIELKRDFAPAYYDRALLLRKAKSIDGKVYRNEQVIEDLKQAAELDPKFTDAYFNIGLIYKEMEMSGLAREYFERAGRVDPSYPGVHLQLGLIAEMSFEFTKAMEEYKKEIAINDNSALAHQRLGFLYSNHSMDFAKAEEEFIKSLKLEPDNIDTLIYYANNLYTMGKYGQSADQFEKVLQLDPKNPTANYNLALVYEKWGKKKLAIEQWQRFLEMNPPGSWAEEAKKRLKELKEGR